MIGAVAGRLAVPGPVLIALALLVALLAPAASADRRDAPTPPSVQRELPQAGLPSERDVWRRLDTPSFTILSSASPERTLRIARQLEGLARAIEQTTRLETRSPVPTTIYIFADDAALHPYKHLYGGEPASMSGALYSRPWGDFIAMNGDRRAAASITVFHEYLHVVLRNNLPGLPLWLEEGLAELFSTFRLDADGGRLGRPVPWHAGELARGEPVPLRTILDVDSGSPLYNRFEHQGELYARSWELVHYLLIGEPAKRGALLDFLSRTFQGASTVAAFETAFGETPEAFDARLAAYRRTGYGSRPIELAAIDVAAPRLVRLAYPEVLLRLGELLASQGERDAAARFHFEQALARRPDFGEAVTGLGLLAQEKGDLPRARALFARALEIGGDARSHYHYARSLLTLGRAVSRAKRTEARRHLERAVELDPAFAPAWLALALARHLEAPRGDDAAPSFADLPPEVALDLLMLHSRERRPAAARELWRDRFESRPAQGRAKGEGPEDGPRRTANRIVERLDWLENGGSPPDILFPPAPAP